MAIEKIFYLVKLSLFCLRKMDTREEVMDILTGKQEFRFNRIL